MLLLTLALACSSSPEPEEAPVPRTAEDHYRAWLEGRGQSTTHAKVHAMPDAGDWTFLHVSPAPGQHDWAAAVRGDTLVTVHESPGWADFLADQDEDALHKQIAWLNGMWRWVEPGRSSRSIVEKHPAAEDLLAAPKRWEEDGAVLFQAWYAEPPAFEPFRMTVRATPVKTEFIRASLRDLTK